MPPPSSPCRVMTASPRTAVPPNDSPARLSGWPSKRVRKLSDQSAMKPQLAGRSGVTSIPALARTSTQRPSEPSRGQLAPPSASTVASACALTSPSGCAEEQGAIVIPADPLMARPERDPQSIEAPQPRAQQRRALERFGKHPPAGADEGRLAQAFAPRAQRRWRERLDRGPQVRHGGTVAREEGFERFAVRQIEAAAAGEQELPSGRRHPIVERDRGASARQDLGGHQPGRTGANDGDLGWAAFVHNSPEFCFE